MYRINLFRYCFLRISFISITLPLFLAFQYDHRKSSQYAHSKSGLYSTFMNKTVSLNSHYSYYISHYIIVNLLRKASNEFKHSKIEFQN